MKSKTRDIIVVVIAVILMVALTALIYPLGYYQGINVGVDRANTWWQNQSFCDRCYQENLIQTPYNTPDYNFNTSGWNNLIIPIS